MTQPAPPSSYILRELIEVDFPEPVSWMPQTLGWKIVGIILFIALVYFGYRKARYWWLNRYRAEAINVTESLSVDDVKFEYKMFVIMKRVMGHLNTKYQAVDGDEFLAVLSSYPLEFPLELNRALGNAWMQSLYSKQFSLPSADKETLKKYCLDWFKHHQCKEQQ